MMSPKSLLRVVSIVEAVTWALLLAGMWAKYGPLGWDLAVSIAGSLHGVAFVAYVYCFLLVASDRKLSWPWVIAGLAASIVPFATLVTDHMMRRRGLVDGDWVLVDVQFPEEERAPLSFLHPVVTWSYFHPFTIGAILIFIFAMTLTSALGA